MWVKVKLDIFIVGIFVVGFFIVFVVEKWFLKFYVYDDDDKNYN